MKPLLKMQIDEHVNNIRRREKKEEKKRLKLEEEARLAEEQTASEKELTLETDSQGMTESDQKMTE